MRISLLAIRLLFVLMAATLLQSQSGMPLLRSVEPASGKAGDVLTVTGENLGHDDVAELYLTDGNNDFKASIVEQTSTSMQFKLPAEAKPGRYSLMVLTKGANPKLLEQPVKVEVTAATTG